MAAYGVRVESPPPGAWREPGAVVACFETSDEAEYIISIAGYLSSLAGCGLAVVVMPMLDRLRVTEVTEECRSQARIG